MDTPMVSILIPVYNAKNYLAECLSSVLAQSYKDFELVLCDDGSTDGSGAMCDEYAGKDTRVRVIHQDNAGNLTARLRLIDEAKGRLIRFVDADDTIPKDSLKETVEYAEASDADIVCFGYTMTEDNGREYKKVTGLFPDGALITEEDRKLVYRAFVSDWTLNSICGKLFKRELFFKVSDRPEIHKNLNGDDRLLAAGMLSKAERIGYLDGPLYNYRLSNDGMGRHYKLDFLKDSQLVNEYVLSLMADFGLADDADAEAGFIRYNARDIVSYIYETAKDKSCTDEELLSAYNEVLESELSCRVRDEVKDFGDSKLQKAIYKGFADRDYAASVRAVRKAFDTKHLIKKLIFPLRK